MVFFGSVKDNFKKAEAAVVIENVLDMQAHHEIFPLDDRSKLANRLIAQVWDENPGLYDGTRHARPHKATLAAKALVEGLMLETYPRIKAALYVASGTVLGELTAKGDQYGLGEIDYQILDGLRKKQVKIGETLQQELGID